MKKLLPVCACVLAIACPASAREFALPLPALDPFGRLPESASALVSGFYGEMEYNQHVFKGSAQDAFNIQVLGDFTALELSRTFALSVYYASYLLVGPLAPGDTPASVAGWWINAFQFQYGLIASLDLASWNFFLEYSRYSMHPIRSGYAEPAADLVKAGVVSPPFRLGPLAAQAWARAGYVDLFDFWQSALPKPPTTWEIGPGLQASLPLGGHASLYTTGEVGMKLLRSGGAQVDVNAELGLALAGHGGAGLRLYFQYFHSDDTEELIGQPTPVDLLGLGLRMSGG